MSWRLKRWRQHSVYLSVCVFLCVSVFGCVCLCAAPAAYERVNHIIFPAGFCNPLWLSYNGQSDCMQMQTDPNAPFAWFLWICLCVCRKIWLLRQCRIDERSSFWHANIHAHIATYTSSILRHSEFFCGERDPPIPPFKRHEIFNGFAGVCVWLWYCVCMIWCLCASVSVWFCICVCWREMEEGTISVCVHIYICCLCVCVRAHAWLSGLSQTAQNSLQSDISPAGDKWWLDERERWGLAGISVSLRWQHIYTHTHLYAHTHTHTL